MSKKTKFSPKVKHKAFASFSVKLQDNDWMIGIFNPNDKTAAYFLAEPTEPHKNSAPVRPKDKHQGYSVSALSRQGLTESLFRGLPRKFKAVEDAMEWLESQIEQYDGDKALPEIEECVEYAKSDAKFTNELHRKLYPEDVEAAKVEGKVFLKHKAASDAARAKKTKTSVERGEAIHAELEKKFSKTGKEIKPQGPNGAKSTKTIHSDQPYIKPASKFKTSKEELKSLGLDGLFDD